MSELGSKVHVGWAMSTNDREAEAQTKKGDDGSDLERDSRAAAAMKQHWDVGLRTIELVSYSFINLYYLPLYLLSNLPLYLHCVFTRSRGNIPRFKYTHRHN